MTFHTVIMKLKKFQDPGSYSIYSWTKLNNKCSEGWPPGTSNNRRLGNFENTSWKKKNGYKPFWRKRFECLLKVLVVEEVWFGWLKSPGFWKQGNNFHITSLYLTGLFISYYFWKNQRNTSQMGNQVEWCSSLENKLK